MANINDKTPSCTTTKQSRQLKVYAFNYFNKRRTCAVPWVQLKGKWLEQAGFNIHDQVNIEIKKGKLIITNQD